MIIIDLCKAFWNRLLANPKKINKPIEAKDLISKDAINNIKELTKAMNELLRTIESVESAYNKIKESGLVKQQL